jgi:hypothetical protein
MNATYHTLGRPEMTSALTEAVKVSAKSYMSSWTDSDE